MLKKPDAVIQKEVMQELHWDARVKETDIGVEVRDGVVTLTGTVDSWAGRHAAERAAHAVMGVLDVANDVTVKLPGSAEQDDSDIALAVREALEWDVFLPADRIRSTVSNGIVTLHGTVDCWSQHEDAAAAVRNLRGIERVENHIVVIPPALTAEQVRSAIEDALARHASDAAKHVHVTVAADKVTLTGGVSSWAENETVEQAARLTAGVRAVDNRLAIEL